MIADVTDHAPETRAPGGRVVNPSVPQPSVAPTDDSRIDEMSESSFPASDPPSIWTWEVKSRTSLSPGDTSGGGRENRPPP
jgi:hypothetical protein